MLDSERRYAVICTQHQALKRQAYTLHQPGSICFCSSCSPDAPSLPVTFHFFSAFRWSPQECGCSLTQNLLHITKAHCTGVQTNWLWHEQPDMHYIKHTNANTHTCHVFLVSLAGALSEQPAVSPARGVGCDTPGASEGSGSAAGSRSCSTAGVARVALCFNSPFLASC